MIFGWMEVNHHNIFQGLVMYPHNSMGSPGSHYEGIRIRFLLCLSYHHKWSRHPNYNCIVLFYVFLQLKLYSLIFRFLQAQ